MYVSWVWPEHPQPHCPCGRHDSTETHNNRGDGSGGQGFESVVRASGPERCLRIQIASFAHLTRIVNLFA